MRKQKPRNKRTTQEQLRVAALKSQRLLGVIDNLIAAAVAAFFVGLIVPDKCNGASSIDIGIELLLAFVIASLYIIGNWLARKIGDR